MTRDDHISNGRMALAKSLANLDAMESATDEGDCCPACVHGSKWTDVESKVERQAEWLARLLVKRGEAGDHDEAKRIADKHVGRSWYEQLRSGTRNGPDE